MPLWSVGSGGSDVAIYFLYTQTTQILSHWHIGCGYAVRKSRRGSSNAPLEDAALEGTMASRGRVWEVMYQTVKDGRFCDLELAL